MEPQIDITGYLTLSDNDQIHMFDQLGDGNLVFTKHFRVLWHYLNRLGHMSYPNPAQAAEVKMSRETVSKLLSSGYMSDASSKAKLLIFELLNPDGPVTSGGHELGIYDQFSVTQVDWEIKDNRNDQSTPVKVGFYTADQIKPDTINELFLMCGNEGPCIFTTEPDLDYTFKGSFRCKSYERMFVAVDADVGMYMKVTKRIPKTPAFPVVTLEQSHTQVLKLKDHYMPLTVFTTTLVEGNQVHKQVSNLFEPAARMIQSFLQPLRLSLNLVEPKEQKDEPVKVPVEEPAKAPVEEPAKVPVEEPAKAPVEEPAKMPVEEPAKTLVEEPAKVPVEEPAKLPVEEPAKVPVEEPKVKIPIVTPLTQQRIFTLPVTVQDGKKYSLSNTWFLAGNKLVLANDPETIPMIHFNIGMVGHNVPSIKCRWIKHTSKTDEVISYFPVTYIEKDKGVVIGTFTMAEAADFNIIAECAEDTTVVFRQVIIEYVKRLV